MITPRTVKPQGGGRGSAPEETLAWLIEAEKLPKPVREYQFAKTQGRRWRFDFSWPNHLVACECEGGIFVQGRHTRGRGFEADCEKYLAALLAGWRVARVTPAMIDDGRAIEALKRLLTHD